MCRAFARHARRYGTRRLQAAGYQVGRHRIRHLLRQTRIYAKIVNEKLDQEMDVFN